MLNDEALAVTIEQMLRDKNIDPDMIRKAIAEMGGDNE